MTFGRSAARWTVRSGRRLRACGARGAAERRAAAAAVAALILACARPYGPPGGEPDRAAPGLVSTTPEAMAVVPEFSRPVVFRFDERISERRLREAVLVSPETGEVDVDKGRSELRVSLEGGWRRGLIYRVVVLPVVQDLFGNVRREPIELVFSTGPPIPPTALAGEVTDRLTARALVGARVEALRRADSVVYVSLTDSAGVFTFRHIPAGAYDLRAYLDQNRNRRADAFEARDTGVAVLGVTDTAVFSFALLAPDTTPARLVRAEARDSLQVRLFLDDPVDPLEPLRAGAELWRLPDSARVEVSALLFPHEFAARQRAAADSARRAGRADTATADTVGLGAARRDSLALRPRPDAPRPLALPPAVEAPAAPADTVPLPTRELVLVPAAPLAPATRYRVAVTGVQNLVGLPGGGGSAAFETPRPARPDSAAAARRAPGAGAER
ncbi:MAG: carboxypeptidase regulatory-like domain-containing protein [Gemmatimonadetes bacterium]|nr:carboxypeptidase regulatory-like domain-containing protein [Gemmatimonadota bacterium]